MVVNKLTDECILSGLFSVMCLPRYLCVPFNDANNSNF